MSNPLKYTGEDLHGLLLNPFQAKDASRQPWPGARDASRQYDTYGAEVSDHICHFHMYFHLIAISEVDEMYENWEEMVPKIAIFDHNTITIKS